MYYHYDQARADRAVNFIKLLRHTKGKWAGVPFNLQPWQEKDIIRPLFGMVDEDGYRQYRTVYIQMARKNGKSEIASGIGGYMLFADGEAGAEIYSAAADRDQASIVFNTAASMIKQEKALSKRCKIIASQKRVVIPKTNSFWRVLSAEAPTKHGLNPHAIIFDELHAQPNRELYDVFVTSFGARTQPLMVMITTAGFDKESICYEVYRYACQVRDGIIDDPTFLPVIYEVPQDADWTDEKLWKLANPGLGEFRSVDELRGMAGRAKILPSFQNTFRRLYLDQWTEQAERWIPMDHWEACSVAVDLEELEGQPCYAGLDLSSTTDITALVLLFPRDDGVVKVVPFFWIPGDDLVERTHRDNVTYDAWIRDKYITATEGNVVDYGKMREDILSLSEKYNIQEIAYDRWNASQLVQELEGEGLTMVPIGQGFASMSTPSKELMNLVLTGKLHHGGHPVLRWMASNAASKEDPAGNIKPDKSKSNARIDGIVATIMGLDRLIRNENGPSVYEDRDLVVL